MDIDTYRFLLKSLDDNLARDDLVVLKFLCQDIIKPSKLDDVICPLDLFDALESAGALEPDNLQLLAELLFEAQRIDLMRRIGVTQDKLKKLREDNGDKINAYRRMLHQLSEHMISSDVRQLKRMMKATATIQRSRLDEANDAYTLFSLLEKQQMITPKDVTQLLKFTKEMDEVGLRQIVSSYADEFCECQNETDVTEAPSSEGQESIIEIAEYPIKYQQKGICLIINNENFEPVERGAKDDLKGPRKGTSKDAESLEKLFRKLSFQVHIYKDLRKMQLHSVLEKYSKMDHSNFDVFICCILTHGEAGKVFAADCLAVSIHSILARFTPRYCHSLENKPKLFFIQACQGGRQAEESLESIPHMDGAELEHIPENLEQRFSPQPDLETDYVNKISNVTNIPRQPDYLLGLATVPGFVSYRSKSNGSWYIQALCELLSKLHNSADLLSILTEVNNRVLSKERRSGSVMATQIPLPQHTLRKRVFLRTAPR